MFLEKRRERKISEIELEKEGWENSEACWMFLENLELNTEEPSCPT
jgi:hypothetical protein